MSAAIHPEHRRGSPCFLGLGDNPQARLRLVCLPFAGGGPSVYQSWLNWLPLQVELVRVQLPGRAKGRQEASIPDIQQLADQLVRHMADNLELPYVLFGYSMGALLAYEMTVNLQDHDSRLPSLFCAAACRPPHLHGLHGLQWSQISNRELLDYLKGLDPVFAASSVARRMLAQNLLNTRADLLACERYVFSRWEALNCPVTTYCADSDPLASPDQMILWERYTHASSIHHQIRGGHFFLLSQGRQLLQQLLRRELDHCLIHETLPSENTVTA